MTLSNEQLALLDETKEVHIRTRSDRRTFETVIWIVVADGTVYARSVNGESGRWYQRAKADPDVSILVGEEAIGFRAVHVDDPDEIERVTEALRSKYRPGGSLDRMTRAEVLDTTVRLEPGS